MPKSVIHIGLEEKISNMRVPENGTQKISVWIVALAGL